MGNKIGRRKGKKFWTLKLDATKNQSVAVWTSYGITLVMLGFLS